MLEALPPGPELAMAYSNCSQLDMLAHETDSAVSWARRTIELAEPLGRPDILSHALNNLGTARLIRGDLGGWEDVERSLELALTGNFQEHAARAYTNMSWQAAGMYQLDRASGYLEDGIAYCDEHDLDSWRLYMLGLSSRVQFERCDWTRASEEAETVLRDPRTAPISRLTALTTVGHMRVRLGDPDPASPLQEARMLAANIGEIQRIAPVVCALAEAAWLRGDRETVVREIREVYERARTQRDPWVRGTLAVWLHRAGALEETPTELANPFGLEISGRWAEAARAWESLNVPYEQALILAWHGGEAEQREALAIFERLGADPASQSLRKRMREQGIQSIPRGSRSSTRQDPHGLTRREAEILGLLCEGLRNAAIAKRLFLSTKTVDHHVSAILTKLGVPSRAEAVAMARKLAHR